MEKFWHYRIWLALFIPSFLIGTTSFLQSVLLALFLIWGGCIGFLCLKSLRFLSSGLRSRFYLFLFMFFAFVYLPYPLISDGGYPFTSWKFWVCFSAISPLIPLFLISEKEKSKASGRDFFFLLFFICGAFLVLGFLREVLDFNELRLWWGSRGYISLHQSLGQIKLAALTNSFFTGPVGGMFLIGLVGAIIYGRLKKRYES